MTYKDLRSPTQKLVDAAWAVLETDQDDCPTCDEQIQEGEGLCSESCPRNRLVVALRPFGEQGGA